MKRSVPGILWVTIVTLAAQALFYAWLSPRMPDFLLVAAAWAVILFGLIVGQRWAFALAIGLTLIDTLLVLIRLRGIGWIALALDVLIVAPLLLSSSYFFTPRPSGEAPESPSDVPP